MKENLRFLREASRSLRTIFVSAAMVGSQALVLTQPLGNNENPVPTRIHVPKENSDLSPSPQIFGYRNHSH